MEKEELIAVIESDYGITVKQAALLSQNRTVWTYQVMAYDGQSVIVRCTVAGATTLPVLGEILKYLHENLYPAETLLFTTNASLFADTEKWRVLVTCFVFGVPIPDSTDGLVSLARALGRLHSLPVPPALPLAEMRPATEVPWALQQLHTLDFNIPVAWQNVYAYLVDHLSQIDYMDALPQVIIHNDVHAANAVQQADGSIVLIDWVGAGRGAAVIDLGFLLSACVAPAPWSPSHPISFHDVDRIIASYSQEHVLSPQEVSLLPDAIRFRALVYGAGQCVNAIQQQQAPDLNQGWWARCTTASTLAEYVRKVLENTGRASTK